MPAPSPSPSLVSHLLQIDEAETVQEPEPADITDYADWGSFSGESCLTGMSLQPSVERPTQAPPAVRGPAGS